MQGNETQRQKHQPLAVYTNKKRLCLCKSATASRRNDAEKDCLLQ